MIPVASWPWGTFGANVVGGFAMGLLAGWLARFNAPSGEPIRLLLAVGLLGGFTTFSSFSLETMLMMERGQTGMALGYAVISVVGAVGALAGGLAVMNAVREANQAELAERSEEHTSELQSLMRSSYAVFCLKKKTKTYGI